MPAASGYQPISSYGAIGNLRSVALVGANGSIDWCCLPELSGPSVFAAILDDRRGGRFRLEPAGRRSTHQRYRGDTCVLESRFDAEGGEVILIDFMPLRGSIIGVRDPDTAPDVYRMLWCTGGEVEVELEWSPRFDYARVLPEMGPAEQGFLARAGDESMLLLGVASDEARVVDHGQGPLVEGAIRMSSGDRRVLVTRYAARGVRHAPDDLDTSVPDPTAANRLLQETCDAWISWAHDNEERPTDMWAGEWTPLVTRSELVLKMLTHPDTGAIAAAPTTSLPEWLGGVRNWDYRYCWVRDGALVIQALHALGHAHEAHDFLEFVERSVREQGDGLQIMYGLHGSTELPEAELSHLEGYMGSRPVRIGNAAAGQRQHDTYGELLDAAYELVRRGERLAPVHDEFLARIADAACESWRRPDSGIWEVRAGEAHYVHSKVMVWVALDRAVRLAEERGLEGDVDRWRASRDDLHDLIMRNGYDERRGSFTQTFSSEALDSAALRFAIEEFLPATDPRMSSTIDRILDELTENGLVYRYRTEDGLPGSEGAFCVCTFWLVDALTLAGRTEEALDIYNSILARANDVGLLAEQIDPRTGGFLGNFPQAYSHLGVINSALYLANAMGRPVPERAALVGLRA